MRERLLAALEGRGAFRRFRDAVHREEVGGRWGVYQEARQVLRVMEWLGATKLLPEAEARAAAAEYERTLEEIRGELGGTTDAELAAVEALERELQTVACRGDGRRLLQVLAKDFVKIGASGRVWDVVSIVDALLEEGPDSPPIEVRDLVARYVTDDLVLVRWESVCGERHALRTSLWRRDLDGWRLTHHQATSLV